MKNEHCCRIDATEPGNRANEIQGSYGVHSTQTLTQRGMGMIKLVFAPMLLAFVPKCPVCLAGYIAFATGLGISVSTATYLRFLMIILCVGSLVYFLFKWVWMFRKKE